LKGTQPIGLNIPIAFVDSPDSLAAAMPSMHDAGMLSLDAEFSLTGTHHCALALLQVATESQIWLVDPLALPGLIQPLLKALATVPWIVHDYSGDGVVFKRLYGVVPNSVLDTMLLAKTLGYAQPSLKTMAKLKLGIDIPKQEQDSNWMLRPLRESQLAYAARDAALLLPLLRALAQEAEQRRTDDAAIDANLKQLPASLRQMLLRIHNYSPPKTHVFLEKIRARGYGRLAVERAKRLMELRISWGNEGDVAAVMELGNRWIMHRVQHPPKSLEALERTIPNPRFRKKRIDLLWKVFSESNK
jgi:ribonuclease D